MYEKDGEKYHIVDSHLRTTTYPLDAIDDARHDLDHGRLQGRGILVPAGA